MASSRRSHQKSRSKVKLRPFCWRLSVMDLVVYQVLVVYSLYAMSGSGYDSFAIDEKVLAAVFASTLCQIWIWTANAYERQYVEVLRAANVDPVPRLTALDSAALVCIYGLPGCPAGCAVAYCVMRPSVASMFGLFVLMLLYAWTFCGFGLTEEFIVEHKQGMNGDGI